MYPRIKSWSNIAGAKLLGFAGYKAGMSHIRIRDNSTSTTKGQIISVPVTIIECPPLKPLSLRFYKQTEDGLKIISEIHTTKELDKNLSRKLKITKKKEQKAIPDKFDKVTLQVYTQPKLTSLKKRPEIFEIQLSNDVNAENVKSFLDNEIKVSDTFKEGQFIDAHAVTVGKGFQGPVKRFGVTLRQKKSEKSTRNPGSLGAWNQQQHTMYRIAHAGQTGFQTRTDYNKLLLKISSNPEEVNPKGGVRGYGLVKSDYVLIKGSVPGPKKRLIRIIDSIRARDKPVAVEILEWLQ